MLVSSPGLKSAASSEPSFTLAAVTALFLSFAVVTAPSASLAPVTAAPWSLGVVTAPSLIWFVPMVVAA